jgi:hypothetical protein
MRTRATPAPRDGGGSKDPSPSANNGPQGTSSAAAKVHSGSQIASEMALAASPLSVFENTNDGVAAL